LKNSEKGYKTDNAYFYLHKDRNFGENIHNSTLNGSCLRFRNSEIKSKPSYVKLKFPSDCHTS